MAMPLVVAEDDGSVPRDAVRRRSSPDIRKLTMPLDLICLGVEILIISMRHHHHGVGRRVDSSSMEFLVLARRGASFCCATRKKYLCLFCLFPHAGLARMEEKKCTTEFLSFTEPNSPPIADSNTPARKKTRKKEISPKKAKRAELRNVNRLKHSAGRDNFQADTKGT